MAQVINRFAMYKPLGAVKATKDKREFSERLGTEMTRQNKGINDLAEAVGISYEMARRYLSGSGRPNFDRGMKIAEWLGVSFDWLWSGSGEVTEGAAPLPGIPLFSTDDKDIDPTIRAASRVDQRAGAAYAVKITTPCGSEVAVQGTNIRLFKSGDIVYISSRSPGIGDFVLLEAKSEASIMRHLIRRVALTEAMEFEFVSDDAKYPRLSSDFYKQLGTVVSVLSST